MADLSVQAVLSANTAGFQREFQSAARTAKRFSTDMKQVGQSVNSVRFDGLNRGFGVFRQVQKQFGSSDSGRKFFGALDDFGDLAFAGAAFGAVGVAATAAVAGVGSFVDLMIRGKDATFGFAGAVNVASKAIIDFFEIGITSNQKNETNKGITKFLDNQFKLVKGLREASGEAMGAFTRANARGFESRQGEALRRRFLPPDVFATGNAARAQIEKQVRDLQKLRAETTEKAIFNAMRKSHPGGEPALQRAMAGLVFQGEMARFKKEIADAQAQLAKLAGAENFRIGTRRTLFDALPRAGRGVGNQFLEDIGRPFGVGGGMAGDALRLPVNRFVMHAKEGFEELGKVANDWKATVLKAAEFARELSLGDIGKFNDQVGAFKEAFRQGRINEEQLGFGVMHAREPLINAAEEWFNRHPVGAVKGTTAAFEEIDRIQNRDRAEKDFVKVAEEQLKVQQHLAMDIGREVARNLPVIKEGHF